MKGHDMGIRFELFRDLIRDSAELTVELFRDLAHIGGQALDELAEDPINYTLESVEDAVYMTKGLIEADCSDIKVKPIPGSVVYCKILGGIAEHSGIYAGNDQIIHLNGFGFVECISPDEFVRQGFEAANNIIYVSAHAGKAVGNKNTAKRARKRIGSFLEYDLLQNNCHCFVSGCITGDFDNPDSFLWMLKHTCRKDLGATSWCIYDRNKDKRQH